MPQKPPSRVLLIVLALLLIFLIPFAVLKPPTLEDPLKRDRVPISNQNHHSPTNETRLNSRTNKRPQTPPTHQAEDLKHFHLSAHTFRNLSLEEAIGILLEDYRQICAASGESPIPIKWSVNGNSKIIPYLATQEDFHTTCRLLALLSGTHFELIDDQITFSEFSDEKITTRQFTVPPTFTNYLNNTFLDQKVDPFAGDYPASNILHQIGLLGADNKMSYSPGEGKIRVTGKGNTQWHFNELVEITCQDLPIQTRLNFTGPNQEPSPSVTMRPGSLHEISTTILQSGRTESYQHSLGFIVSPYGLGEKIEVYHHVEKDPFDGYLLSFETLPAQTHIIGPGDSAGPRMIELQIPDSSGTLQQRTLTLQRIDATGRPITTKGDPIPGLIPQATPASVRDLPGSDQPER